MATSTLDSKTGELTERVTGILDSAFDSLSKLNAQVGQLYTGEELPASSALDQLGDAVIGTLGGPHGLIVGTGFIAGPGALSDADLGAQWWKSGQDGEPVKLVLELDPANDAYLDFTRLPWFVVPREQGNEHITGPYVDYVCTDEYSLTLSAPVFSGTPTPGQADPAHGRFLGVVGADIYVRSLEIALLPALRALGASASLVNDKGRIIVSNSLRYGTGSLIRQPRLAAALMDGSPSVAEFVLHRCGRHPITLIIDRDSGRF